MKTTQFEAMPCYSGFVVLDHINQECTYVTSGGVKVRNYDEENWKGLAEFLHTPRNYTGAPAEFWLGVSKVLRLFGRDTVLTLRGTYEI